MARSSKKSRRRLARGTSVPTPREELSVTGPVPVMDDLVSKPAEPVDLEAASAAVRSVLAEARSRRS